MNKNLANSRFFAEFFIGIVGLQQRSHVGREEGGILTATAFVPRWI